MIIITIITEDSQSIDLQFKKFITFLRIETHWKNANLTSRLTFELSGGCYEDYNQSVTSGRN